MKANDNNQNGEIKKTLEKNSFVFYHSYFEAIETLSRRDRLIAYEAITKYALYGEEAKELPNRVLGIMVMAKPNIDAAHKNYLRRMKSTSQKNKRDTFAPIDEEPIEKVPLPLKGDGITEDIFGIEGNDDCFRP